MKKFYICTLIFILCESQIYSQTTEPASSEQKNSDSEESATEVYPICGAHQKCVRHHNCINGELNFDGSNAIKERSEQPEGQSVDETSVCVDPRPWIRMTCCNKTEYIEVPFLPDDDDDSNDGYDLSDFSNHNVSLKSEKNQCFELEFTTPDKCGFRNPKGLGRSVEMLSMKDQTIFSNYAEFPWMVAVLIKFYNEKLYKSGGSLIHPRVVLTAAHSIIGKDPKKLLVRGGEWNTQTEYELRPHVERNVERVIIHKKFNRKNLQNDIALLILEEGFEMTPFINTVCLPPKNSNFDHQRCLSAGWGRFKYHYEIKRHSFNGIFKNTLKKVELPIFPHSKCQANLGFAMLGDDFHLFKGFLCAGGEEGKDMCTGDSGSPLMCEIEDNPGHYHQVGIVVGGLGCGTIHTPGLYTDVSQYREWIKRKIGI